MKCDLCGQKVENADALEAHREQVHRPGVLSKSMRALETPDLLGDTPEESAAGEVRLPKH